MSYDSPRQAGTERARFLVDAIPIISGWFSGLPISSDRYVFEDYEASELASELWDNLLQDRTGKLAPNEKNHTQG